MMNASSPLRAVLLAGVAGTFLCAALPARAAEDAALDAAVHNPQRSPKFVARDAARHPAAELEFFGLRPDASVVEIWPGGGYWTEILAPYLAAHGTYTVALPADTGDEHSAAKFRAKFEGKPGYTGMHLVTLDKDDYGLKPGSADFVLTFRNVHNWMGGGYALNMFQAFYSALKPGGIAALPPCRRTLPPIMGMCGRTIQSRWPRRPGSSLWDPRS